jgi:hypothetical protein
MVSGAGVSGATADLALTGGAEWAELGLTIVGRVREGPPGLSIDGNEPGLSGYEHSL